MQLPDKLRSGQNVGGLSKQWIRYVEEASHDTQLEKLLLMLI